MNHEHILPGDSSELYYHTSPRRKRISEQGRDPYDGLRPWSAITHGLGALLGVAGTVALLLRAGSLGLDAWHVASFLIYGLSMVGLYTASTLYHCVNTSVKGRIALRKYDHTSIYLLIAGSYTPILPGSALADLRPLGLGPLRLDLGAALPGFVLRLASDLTPPAA